MIKKTLLSLNLSIDRFSSQQQIDYSVSSLSNGLLYGWSCFLVTIMYLG